MCLRFPNCVCGRLFELFTPPLPVMDLYVQTLSYNCNILPASWPWVSFELLRPLWSKYVWQRGDVKCLCDWACPPVHLSLWWEHANYPSRRKKNKWEQNHPSKPSIMSRAIPPTPQTSQSTQTQTCIGNNEWFWL